MEGEVEALGAAALGAAAFRVLGVPDRTAISLEARAREQRTVNPALTRKYRLRFTLCT